MVVVQRRHRFGLAVLLALGCGGLAAHGYGAVARELATPHSLAATPYVGSDACRSCHPDHSESFRRTFHRTMTQDAGPHSVLGDFDSGATLDYFGVRARMTRGEAGEFLMTFSADGGAQRWQARIERTVGSHRYQQYLARDRDVYFRLPVAWDVGARRFIHMNGAFLTPDPAEPPPGSSIERADYDRHVTRWNDNCIFCHNVQPNPGLDLESGAFDTQVAELGIACEACHGPGADHVARNRNPLRRYALQLTDRRDPSIRNPAHMTGPRSAEVCGRCHGQRITSDLDRFLVEGDPFVPGDPLGALSRPLFRDTTQNGETGLFAARFWNDGTARLTAYEYQGYLQSPCALTPEFSCESCHAMHRGDPRGQIHPERAGDAACTQCHTELSESSAERAHSRHDAAQSCRSCHMPDVVYGLVGVKISHRIELPDPARDAEAQRPDACTSCHVDQTRGWAIDASARLFGTRAPAAERGREAGLPEVTRQLFAGDPIERAVAAHALGQATATSARDHGARILRMLSEVLATDPYPAVRSVALHSLRARLARDRSEWLPLLAAYSATDTPSRRREVLAAFEAAQEGPDYPDAATQARLRAEAEQVAIEIGE